MSYLRTSGGGNGSQGHSENLNTYNGSDHITCPFNFTKVQAIFRRNSDSVLMAATYTKGDANQYFFQGTTMNAVAIGASGWNCIISEVGNDYIVINGVLKNVYISFVKE